MKQELKIIKAKQEIELDDMRKQQNYLDVQIVKKQGQKRDLESEIDDYADKAEELAADQDEIDKLILLKKRLCLKLERIKADELNQKLQA